MCMHFCRSHYLHRIPKTREQEKGMFLQFRTIIVVFLCARDNFLVASHPEPVQWSHDQMHQVAPGAKMEK